MTRFHVASAEEIKQGETTDIYFVRTKKVLAARGLMTRRAYAEFTVGGLPDAWPWAVFCGLEEVVALLEGQPVDVTALVEGTVFPAKDCAGVRVPVMTIEGPYGAYCVYETPALGLICQATGVATKAARIRRAAGKAQVLGFGTRRMHPAIGPMIDRASYIGGVDGVSGLAGAKLLGIEPRGTMPHALVVLLGDAKSAWSAFDVVLPGNVPRVALVDTYSDEKAEALAAAELLGKKLAGIRMDTPASRRGDFPELVREVRWELDLRGYRQVRIFVSGGLNEAVIPALAVAGATGFGVGTAIANAPTVDFAMDVVEVGGRPCAKRGRMGGRKAAWRCRACGAYVVRPVKEPKVSCPSCRKRTEPLLQPVLKRGKLVRRLPSASQIRDRVLTQLAGLTQ